MNDFDELIYEIAERAGISEDRGWATISVGLLDRILAALKTDGAPIKWRSERLERCPCGGKAEIVCDRYDERKFWFVRCKQCGRGLSACDVLDAIIEAWNRRAKDAE